MHAHNPLEERHAGARHRWTHRSPLLRSSQPGIFSKPSMECQVASFRRTKLEPVYDLDRLAGVLVALASPITRDGEVDEGGVARLVDHVLAGGVHGLLALGST